MDAETREALGELKERLARIEERLSALVEIKGQQQAAIASAVSRVEHLERAKWQAHGAAAAVAAIVSWVGAKWSSLVGGHQ